MAGRPLFPDNRRWYSKTNAAMVELADARHYNWGRCGGGFEIRQPVSCLHFVHYGCAGAALICPIGGSQSSAARPTLLNYQAPEVPVQQPPQSPPAGFYLRTDAAMVELATARHYPCAVCAKPFELGQLVVYMWPCLHFVHQECSTISNCPICGGDLPFMRIMYLQRHLPPNTHSRF